VDTVAFIPVRGGSKSIPRKNIRPLAGRPLVHWAALAALECPAIDRVYVASDDAEIRAVAARLGNERLHVIDRDPVTATDEAPTEAALLEFARAREFGRVVLIQATSPLVTASDLCGALALLDAAGQGSLLSVTRERRFRWAPSPDGSVVPVNYNPRTRPRRQDWAGELFENGAFYITTRKDLLESGCRLSGAVLAWEMAPETALELDEPSDWEVAAQRLAARARPADLAARCRPIELLVSDVDGVLTDAGMYYGPEGETLKKFNTRDGMGFGRWRQAGLRAALVTSETTPIVERRAAKLQIELVRQGATDKAAALDELLVLERLTPDQVAYIGDDLNDLPALARVGLAACPADAAAPNRAIAHYVCTRRGGDGCLRELVDYILEHKGARC
jgi:N-acylneuraminate cytidylyltransferase